LCSWELDFSILIIQVDEQDEERPMIGIMYEVLRGSSSPNSFTWKGSSLFLTTGNGPNNEGFVLDTRLLREIKEYYVTFLLDYSYVKINSKRYKLLVTNCNSDVEKLLVTGYLPRKKIKINH
jgi:hypothetical protein